jgi:putative transposase
VTHKRAPYLATREDADLLLNTALAVQAIHPFRLIAYVILPDHFHTLLGFQNNEEDFSRVLHSIKRNFTARYKMAHNIAGSLSLWQARFWDHVIRSERDFGAHLDYIHWNPVKHGLVDSAEAWPFSTFVLWVAEGHYSAKWGTEAPESIRGIERE